MIRIPYLVLEKLFGYIYYLANRDWIFSPSCQFKMVLVHLQNRDFWRLFIKCITFQLFIILRSFWPRKFKSNLFFASLFTKHLKYPNWRTLEDGKLIYIRDLSAASGSVVDIDNSLSISWFNSYLEMILFEFISFPFVLFT